MKKFHTIMQNENVMATIIITAVFLITALITFFAIYL